MAGTFAERFCLPCVPRLIALQCDQTLWIASQSVEATSVSALNLQSINNHINMKPFNVHLPTHLYFGAPNKDAFFNALRGLGNKALIVIGGGSVERFGILAEVHEALAERGIEAVTFKGIEPNPLAQTIDRAAELGRKEKVAFVLAVGGGSVMDAAKAISALIHDGESNIWPFTLGQPRKGQLKGALPIATIPTTAATASEVTPHSVVSNKDVNGKASISYPFMKPVASWLQPAYHVHLGPITTADGAADILSHVLENYLLGGSDARFTDRYCEAIIKTVMETLEGLQKDPSDVALRGEMQWVSMMALNGFHAAGRNTSPYPLHAIEHSMSGWHHELAHGRGLATLFPAYFRMLLDHGTVVDRLARLAREVFAVGADAEDSQAALLGIEAFEAWMRKVGLYQGMDEIGIGPEGYGPIAEYALSTYGNGTTLPCAWPFTREDLVELFERANRQR